MNNTKHIAWASDHAYVPQMEASIISVLEHESASSFVIHIMDNGMSEEDIDCVRRTIGRYGAEYRFHDLRDLPHKMGFLPPPFQESLGLYCRIFLPEILSDVDEALYLDCDVIAFDILEGLWETDISGCYIGAIQDTISKEHKKAIGLSFDSIYVNSGVLLMNLKRWREDEVSSKIVDYIDAHKGDKGLPDQDAINVVCKDSIRILSPRYNAMSPIFLMDYENVIGYFNVEPYYNEAEIEEAVKAPVLVHFTGYPDVRPWQSGCHHPLRAEYEKYSVLGTAWGGILQKKRIPIQRRIRLMMFRHLPFRMYSSLRKVKKQFAIMLRGQGD